MFDLAVQTSSGRSIGQGRVNLVRTRTSRFLSGSMSRQYLKFRWAVCRCATSVLRKSVTGVLMRESVDDGRRAIWCLCYQRIKSIGQLARMMLSGERCETYNPAFEAMRLHCPEAGQPERKQKRDEIVPSRFVPRDTSKSIDQVAALCEVFFAFSSPRRHILRVFQIRPFLRVLYFTNLSVARKYSPKSSSFASRSQRRISSSLRCRRTRRRGAGTFHTCCNSGCLTAHLTLLLISLLQCLL